MDHGAWMMIDGAINPGALPAIFGDDAGGSGAMAVLHGTDYAAIADSGPLLVRAGPGSRLMAQWRANERPARHAWVFQSDRSDEEVVAFWQRRLFFLAPDGRRFWFRFADARVMSRAHGDRALPGGFWQGLSGVRFHPRQAPWSPVDEAREGADTGEFVISEGQAQRIAGGLAS